MTEATATQWTLRVEIRTGAGEVQSRELASLSRPARAASAQQIGLKAERWFRQRRFAPCLALDSAYVRATTACPNRHLEVITGKVEAPGRPSRRFGLVSAGTDRPHRPIRSALEDQGWQPGQPLTVISDGDPSLPARVRAAADHTAVEHVLDWFHLSMRVRHIEQAVQGLYA